MAADTFADTTAPGDRMQFSSCAPSSTLDPFINTQFTKTEFGPTNAFWAITDSSTFESSETSAGDGRTNPARFGYLQAAEMEVRLFVESKHFEHGLIPEVNQHQTTPLMA